jgi:cytochrome c oxidase subunit IV
MKPEPASIYVRAWIALLALLAATCASSFVPMGSFNVVVNIGIAWVKALIVALFFMHLRKGRAIIRLVALAGVAWLLFLVGLSSADFLVRLP